MSPELERLLNALWERDTCAPKDQPKWRASVHRLVQDARARHPGLSYEEFMDAVWPRYEEFRRSRRKPPAMPPKA